MYPRITSKRRCIAVMSVIWLALAAFFVLILTVGPGSSSLEKYYRISKDGVQTRGTVTEKEPKNHNTVHYAYRVEGRDYEGAGRAGPGNPPFEKIEVGEGVLVYYLPTEPYVSCLGEPRALFNEEVFFVVSAALLLPTFGVLVYGYALCRPKASSE